MMDKSDARRQYIERLICKGLAEGLVARRKAIAANDQRRKEEDIPPPRESSTRAIDDKPFVA